MVSKKLRIHGRVQGVFYRAWATEEARNLDLRGWVRNRRDGTVDLVAHGPAEAVETLVERCRKGPPAAAVERVDIEGVEEEIPAGFEQRPTV